MNAVPKLHKRALHTLT